MRKKIIIGSAVVLVLTIVGFYLYKLNTELTEEKKINNEFNKIIEYNKKREENKDKIDEILNQTISENKKYQHVEIAAKKYLQDLYSYIDNVNYLVSSENTNYLSIENLKKDRPDFTKSKENINNTKNQLTENINKIVMQLTDENTIISYIKEYKLDKYYINFYKELVSSSEQDAESIKNKYNYLFERLDTYIEALDFLTENNKYWRIQNGDNLIFEKTELYEEYLNITYKLDNTQAVSTEE